MLSSLALDLQKQHEEMDFTSILLHLKELFFVHAHCKGYEVSKALYKCKVPKRAQDDRIH